MAPPGAAQSDDAFGATAVAPEQAPGGAPGAPPGTPGGGMPPTGAMSGFGGAEPAPPPGFGPPPGADPGQPAPPAAAPAPSGGSDAGPDPAAGSGKNLVGFLVSFQDEPNGMFWPLHEGRNEIGRAETGEQVDIPIGHGTTSTHHAVVEADGQSMSVSDLGSTNGTFHNEEAIGFQGKRTLKDGDKIRFGGFSVFVIDVRSKMAT